jgi:uncharacterized protein (DUF433 family)
VFNNHSFQKKTQGTSTLVWKDRITVNPKIMVGKPIIKGTRITVAHIVDLLAQGWTMEEILKNYPQLKKQDLDAALKYAAELLKQEKVYPLM